MQAASEYMVFVEQKCYDANCTSLDLVQKLKKAEERMAEVSVLKSYIIDLKQRIPVYVPLKTDPLDKRLAEHINNCPERQQMKLMFMRESEGVYEYGSKRLMIKAV